MKNFRKIPLLLQISFFGASIFFVLLSSISKVEAEDEVRPNITPVPIPTLTSAPMTAFTDEGERRPPSDCEPICGPMRNASSAPAPNCGGGVAGEGLNRSGQVVANEQLERATCAQRIFSEWGQSKTQCDSMDALEKVRDLNIALTALYTAVGAVCTVGCVWPPFVTVCTVSSLVVAVTDTVSSIAVKDQLDSRMTYTVGGWDGIATGVAGMAAGGTVAGFQGASSIAGAAAQAGGRVVTSAAEKSQLLGSQASQRAADKAAQTAACVTAGISYAIAVWKGVQIGVYEDLRHVACGRVMKVQSLFANQVRLTADPGSGVTGPKATGTGQLGNTTGRGGPTGSGSITGAGGGGGSRRLSDQISENEMGTPSALLSAASADTGLGASLIGGLSSKNNLGEAVKLAGLNLKDIARQVEAGRTPQQILSSATKLPNEVKAVIAKIDPKKLTINGKPMMLASAASAGASGYGMNLSSSSGGSAPKAAPGVDFGKMFGGKAGQPAGAPGSMSFGKKGDTETPGDIFHTGTTRTVFEIVTQKILKVDEDRRVQKFEWCTGINRAMHGLPNLGVEIRQCTPL